MNKFVKILKKMFGINSSYSYGKCLSAIKAKYEAVGKPIFKEPGVVVYRKRGTNDVLRISTNNGLNIETLFPYETPYEQYQARVGKQVGFVRNRTNIGSYRMVKDFRIVVNDVVPTRYAKRCEKGGLSRMHIYDNKGYFCPSTACVI